MARRKKSNILLIIVAIVGIYLLLNNNSQLGVEKTYAVYKPGKSSVVVEPEQGRQGLSRTIGTVGSNVCSGTPDYGVDKTWKAPAGWTRLYFTSATPGKIVQMWDVSYTGWSKLTPTSHANADGDMSLYKGEEAYYNVVAGNTYVFYEYYCYPTSGLTCSDNDGKGNYQNFGFVTTYDSINGQKIYDDSCTGDYVQERFCATDDTVSTESYNCKNYGSNYVCLDGICQAQQVCNSNTGCINGDIGTFDCNGNILSTSDCGTNICDPTTVTCKAQSQLSTELCSICSGDNVMQVPITSGVDYTTSYSLMSLFGRQADDTRVCELSQFSGKQVGHNTKTPLMCRGSYPIENPEYFKPLITNIWVQKDITYDPIEMQTVVSSDRAWYNININQAGNTWNIPYDVTQKWTAGSYIWVVVEYDNSNAKSFSPMSLSEIDKLKYGKVEAAWNQIVNWGIKTLNVIGIGHVIDAASDTNIHQMMPVDVKQALNGMPYYNLVIAEAAIYGAAASEIARPGAYGRYWLEKEIFEETLYKKDSCQGGEAGFESEQGWIETYSVLIKPPIDGKCEATTQRTEESNIFSQDPQGQNVNAFGNAIGGACKPRILFKLKIPEPGDKLANSGAINWDTEGKYYLHASMFDRCWNPDPRYSTTIATPPVKITFQLPQITADIICCKTTNYETFWDTFLGLGALVGYSPMTESECLTKTPAGEKVNIDLCKSTATEWCYRCNVLTKTPVAISVPLNSCGTQENYPASEGWTKDKAATISECNSLRNAVNETIPTTYNKYCSSCQFVNAKMIYSIKPTNEPCSDNTYPITLDSNKNPIPSEEWLQNCKDECGGQCDYETELCIPPGVCQPKGDAKICAERGVICYSPQVLVMPNGICECRTPNSRTDIISCYICDPTSTTSAFKFANITALLLTTEDEACIQKSAYSYKMAQDICEKQLPVGTAFINPNNQNEWCVMKAGKDKVQSCAEKSYPRKTPISISKISSITKADYSGHGETYLDDKNIPICYADYGDVQCLSNATCKVAIDSGIDAYRENKQVFDALEPIIDKWYTLESVVENYGVCTYTKQPSVIDSIRSWIAKLFGWDPSDAKVTYVMVGGIIGIIFLVVALSKPPKKKNQNEIFKM